MRILYTVRPGDTLSSIAQRFGVATRELARLNNIENGTLPSSGQTLNVPNGPGLPTPWAPGTDNVDYRVPVDAPLRGDPKARHRAAYDEVINQFAVEENPRYKPRRNGPYYTYCNIFV